MNTWLLHTAFHAALLSAAAFMLTSIVRRPYAKAWLAMAGLLISGLLPWITALERAPERPQASVPPAPAPASLPIWTVIRLESPTPPPQIADPAPPPVAGKKWSDFAAPAWLLGGALALGFSLFGSMRIALWKRRLAPADDAAWEAIRRELPECRRSEIRIADTAISPCVAGVLRPAIVIPRRLLSPEHRREIRWALRHEWCHRHSHDTRWFAAASLVRALFWWNPFAHLLAARWSAARERVCDLAAAGAGEDRAAYGAFLVTLAADPSHSHAAMARGPYRRLRRRIAWLLSAGPDALSGKRTLFSGSLFLALAAILVSTLRISGQAPEPRKNTQPPPSDAAAPAQAVPIEPEKHLQIMLRPSFILSDRPLAPDRITLNPETGKNLVDPRSEIESPHPRLIMFPSIAARAGEHASIEIIREHPADMHRDEKRYLGWKFSYRSRFDGASVELEASPAYSFVPGRAPRFDPDAMLRTILQEEEAVWNDLAIREGNSRALLAPGETLITRLGEIEPGIHATMLTTVHPIDHAGRVMADYASALYEAPKRIYGRVRLSGTIIELASAETEVAGVQILGEDIPSPARPPILVGVIPTSLEKRFTENTKTTRLPTVNIPAHRVLEPWDELRGIAFCARLSEEQQDITLEVIRLPDPANDTPAHTSAGIGLLPGIQVIFEIDPVDDTTRRVLLLKAEKVE